MSLANTSKTGDRVATLQALRDVLASGIDNADNQRDVAALALRLTDVLSQLDELAPRIKQASPADEIAKRRAARRGVRAKSPARAPRSG